MRARTSSESDREIIKIVYFKKFHTVENTSVLKYFQQLLNKDGMFSEKDTSGQERVHVKFFFSKDSIFCSPRASIISHLLKTVRLISFFTMIIKMDLQLNDHHINKNSVLTPLYVHQGLNLRRCQLGRLVHCALYVCNRDTKSNSSSVFPERIQNREQKKRQIPYT